MQPYWNIWEAVTNVIPHQHIFNFMLFNGHFAKPLLERTLQRKEFWASGVKVRWEAQSNFNIRRRLAEMFILVLNTLFWFSATSLISLIWIIILFFFRKPEGKRVWEITNIHYCSECTIALSPKRHLAFDFLLRNLNITIGKKGNASKLKGHKSMRLHAIRWTTSFPALHDCFHGCCWECSNH